MKFHPVASIFPLMEGEEYEALKEDIRQHGLIEPIWIFEGKILDGRNRYRACKEAGVEPKYREWKGGSAISLVVSLNLKRRHLTMAQRASAAVEALPHYEEEAKERQKQHGGTAPGRKTLTEKIPEVSGMARDRASRDFKVNPLGLVGMTWLYQFILSTDWPQYKADGWLKCGPGPRLGGWESVIVRKKI